MAQFVDIPETCVCHSTCGDAVYHGHHIGTIGHNVRTKGQSQNSAANKDQLTGAELGKNIHKESIDHGVSKHRAVYTTIQRYYRINGQTCIKVCSYRKKDTRNVVQKLFFGGYPNACVFFTLAIYMMVFNMVSGQSVHYPVGVLARLSCDDYGGRVSRGVIEYTFTAARQQFGLNNINFTLYNNQIIDVCGSENIALSSVLSWTTVSSSPVRAIIGPSLTSLCDTTATLARSSDKSLVAYSCMDDRFSYRQLFPTFRSSIPDASMSARALTEMMRHFQWKRVAIVRSGWEPWLGMANDVQRILSAEEFIVKAIVSLPANFTREQARDALKDNIDNDIKAIVACMSTSNMASFLLGAHMASLTSGSHALFVMDVYGMFSLDDLLTSTSEDANITVDDDSAPLQHALKALFVLRSSPSSALDLSFNASQTSQTAKDIQNAIFLLAAGVQKTDAQGGDFMSGVNVMSAMSNLTFNSTAGTTIMTDSTGTVISYFTLYDYNPDTSEFPAVLEVSGSTWALSESDVSIMWPAGGRPAPDTCDFIDCTPAEIPVGAIVAIVLVLCILSAVGVIAGLLIRRRMLLKEMEKGPNKILLTTDDLTFVSPKSVTKNSRSFKSQSIFDKPDLLKASAPSLSLHSFNNEFGEFTDVARYCGDMVYVKELKIKNFEIKGKVRNFIKTLRDLRHENINPFVGCFIDPLRPSLVSEFCQRRSLEDVLSNETIKLDWDFKLSLITDLVRGMRYIHGSPIKQHGNLKSGNCVIDSRWVLKITEYGLAGMYERFEANRDQKNKELLWTAPEVLRDETLLGRGTQKGDVYSFAIILQEIIVRGHPFCMLELDVDEIIKKIRKPPPLCRPSVSQQLAPPTYIQIMKQCWAEVPDMRPEFDQINQQIKDMNKGKKVNVVDTMFKMLEKYSNDLEETVRVRTSELEDEKKKTENLLAQMLPASVATTLMTGKPVEAESFQEVTIYFSDIVGFTTISAMSTPMQVVQLLNDLYTMFDSTIENHDVYKVETIGDAYMVVSGLPERNGNRHAGEVAAMSLNLLVQCGSFKIRHMPDIPMMLRIGLHSGPCVAGVVGLRMPRYCLFGDTVNTASRMESTGEAYRIHVSGHTKAVLDELGGYVLDFRGETELKGKGIHKTYWLVGMEGFNKELPVPPETTGPDNHGLKAYLDKDQIEAAEKQKAEAEKQEAEVEAVKQAARHKAEAEAMEKAKEAINSSDNTQNDSKIEKNNKTTAAEAVNNKRPEFAVGNGNKGDKIQATSKTLENGGQTVVAEINHVNETFDSNIKETPTRKTSVLKQEDIKISAKQSTGDQITPVESVK